jgi:hypothetical protein
MYSHAPHLIVEARMPQFRLPFSGDVTQAINPWTWMSQMIGNQFGVNINLGQSAEPALERLILDEVGSYGRQLGRIGDAMRVLITKVRDPAHQFTPDDIKALDRLIAQLDDIDGVKTRYQRDAAAGRAPRS